MLPRHLNGVAWYTRIVPIFSQTGNLPGYFRLTDCRLFDIIDPVLALSATRLYKGGMNMHWRLLCGAIAAVLLSAWFHPTRAVAPDRAALQLAMGRHPGRCLLACSSHPPEGLDVGTAAGPSLAQAWDGSPGIGRDWVNAGGWSMPDSPPEVVAGASPVVTPTYLFAQVPQGEQELQTLTLANEGAAPFPFVIYAVPLLRGIVPWLQTNPTQGTLMPGAEATIEAIFDATSMTLGLHSAAMIIQETAREPLSVTVPVFLEVVEPQVVPLLTPTILSSDLTIGDSERQTLTVGNGGNVPLVFTWTTSPPEWPAWLEVSPVTGVVEVGHLEWITATFDAAGAGIGYHSTNLLLENNGPSAPVVAVEMWVRLYTVHLPIVLSIVP
jgi:hypothetical protein